MSEVVARLREVSKSFGDVEVLRELNLEVRAGEIVALVGRNGAGKSTALRVMAGTVVPDRGAVEIAGRPLRVTDRALRGRVGIALADDRSWYGRLGGRANLEFFATLRGLNGATRAEEVRRVLQVVRLSDVEDRAVQAYSSGMKARLAIARALLGSPSVLLLDEPTRSVDAVVAAELHEVLGALRGDGSLAVAIVSHSADEVHLLADRVYWLRPEQAALEVTPGGPGWLEDLFAS